MSQAAKAQEPSMEEILASIRRIIADDDGAKPKAAEPPRPPVVEPPPPAPPPPPPPPPPQNVIPVPSPVAAPVEPEPDPAEDVLDLTPAMEVAGNAPTGFQTISPSQDLVFEEPPAASEPPSPAEDPAPPSTVEVARRDFEHSTGDERSMLAQSTVHAVDAAFNSLAQSVLVHNSQTLDGLVREMLRPMLKAWLDDNLPNMVERLVRAEIERVSRGH
jgi:cell pole-organizing protein PopZ